MRHAPVHRAPSRCSCSASESASRLLSSRALSHAPSYRRREPHQTVLYRAVQKHHRAFLAACDEADKPVPKFVVREFERYLACGDLTRGFANVACAACGYRATVT